MFFRPLTRSRVAACAAFVTLAVTGVASQTASAALPLATPVPLAGLPALQPIHEILALCEGILPGLEACRSGRNEHTRGGPGTGMVSHAEWPPFNGVLWRVSDLGRGKHYFVAGPHSDKLMGHHSDDTLAGKGGSDVLWGDYDPKNNNSQQRDYLSGGTGDDFLYSSHGRNVIKGGQGNDFIQAYYGRGSIDCGSGKDTVRLRRKQKTYKVRHCEKVKYPCKFGNDGNGRCLTKAQRDARKRD
jgi:hypothetical protein